MHVKDNRSMYKSSAVAEMGDRGHNRHGPKSCCAPFADSVIFCLSVLGVQVNLKLNVSFSECM